MRGVAVAALTMTKTSRPVSVWSTMSSCISHLLFAGVSLQRRGRGGQSKDGYFAIGGREIPVPQAAALGSNTTLERDSTSTYVAADSFVHLNVRYLTSPTQSHRFSSAALTRPVFAHPLPRLSSPFLKGPLTCARRRRLTAHAPAIHASEGCFSSSRG
jgi:hypothetical protein